MKKQPLFRSGLFLGLLCLLLAAASWVVYPKDNKDIGRRQDRLSTGLLAEAPETVDVLFIGDSLPMWGTAAPLLWEQQGIPAYTYATPQQNMVKSRRMLLTALKRQSPKLVFLEVNGLYRQIGSQEVWGDWLSSLIPAVNYHDNWKKIPLSDMLRPVAFTTVQTSKGYYLTMEQSVPNASDYMNNRDPESTPVPEAVELLDSIRQICRENGVELVLYSVPNVNWSWDRHNAVDRVSAARDLTYLDLNIRDLGIDWSTDCMDWGDHLNYLGAAKATAWLSDWIAQTYALPDKRDDPRYIQWDAHIAHFRSQAEEALAGGLIPQ